MLGLVRAALPKWLKTVKVQGEYTMGPRFAVQFRAVPEPLPGNCILELAPDYRILVNVDEVDATGLAHGGSLGRIAEE